MSLSGYSSAFMWRGAGGLVVAPVCTGAYTASPGQSVPIDSTGGAFTVNLPPTPAHGSRVRFADVGGACGDNPVRISGNGNTINGSSDDLRLNVGWAVAELEFFAGRGWLAPRAQATNQY